MTRPPTLPLHLGAWSLPLLLALPAAAEDWPQFRGPARDGVSRETGLLRSWPEGGPNELWRVPLGEGFSGVSVADGRLFTMYGDAKGEYLAAFDAGSGKSLWKVRLDEKYRNWHGNGPRSTPTVDGNTVFGLSANGLLLAADVRSGEKLWSRNVRETLDARVPRWGISTSPLVEGELVILDAGGASGRSVVALDRGSGEVAWTAGSDKAGYSSPIVVTVGGVRQVIAFTGTRLVSLSPTGSLLWEKEWRTSYDVNAATPVFIPPDRLFVASGYDTGGALLRVGTDAGAVEEIWRQRGMKNQFSSSVYHGGVLYGFDNSTLKAIDARTGEEQWKVRPGLGHGSLTYADGHLVVLGDHGRLVLVEATPEAYREKGSVEILTGKCWTVPTVSNGRLYVRNEKELVALDVRG